MPRFAVELLTTLLLLTGTGIASAGPDSSRYGSDEPLSSERAFPMSVMTGRNGQVLVMWQLPPGYYIYRDKISFASRGGLTIKRVRVPDGQVKNDPLMGSVRIYRDMVTVVVEPAADGVAGELLVKFQGCAEDRLCYPPMTRVFKVHG